MDIEGVLRVLLEYYSKIGLGHSAVMLDGVRNSDRHPFVITPFPGVERSLGLDPRKCRVVTLAQLKDKLAGASGPIAWEHTALQSVLRHSLAKIMELEADLQEAKAEIQHLKMKD